MLIDFDNLTGGEAYRWMSQMIVPRPIAWVSTISPSGITNLAPFSFFQGVTSKPPTLLFVPVNDRHGRKKDTVINIEAIPEFVVNLATTDLLKSVDQTAEALPYGMSEFERFGIDAVNSQCIRPPRVRQCPLALECELDRIVTIGEGPFAANVVFGRIRVAHVDDALISQDGELNATILAPLARIGSSYATVDPIDAWKGT
jgi:flavin reductase (DIM6/NTAB) family NADH-FMN oxidoreductase RutF